jgi:hypothetical protein
MEAEAYLVPDGERSPGTLGAVLYSNPSKPPVSEAEWVALVRSIAAGDQLALHAIHERAHPAAGASSSAPHRGRPAGEPARS